MIFVCLKCSKKIKGNKKSFSNHKRMHDGSIINFIYVNKGKKFSQSTRKKISLSKMNEKNPIWKGDKVGYIALHAWVKRKLVKIKTCENCNKNKSYDLANKSGWKTIRSIKIIII